MTKARAVAAAILAVAASGYFLLIYATRALSPAVPGLIGQIDLWFAELFLHLRNPALVRFFTFVTAFGYWGVVFILAGSASAIMWLYRRTLYVPGLWLGLIGNQIAVSILKAVFGRPRPALAVYHESSPAFPSGHSAASALVFGFLTYVLIRERIGPRIVAGVTGLTLIVMVGLSRLYLDEHYVSDVLNGYLVGAVWLVLAISFSEWRSAKVDPSEIPQILPWRKCVLIVVFVSTGIGVWCAAATYQRGLKVSDPSVSGPLSPSAPIGP